MASDWSKRVALEIKQSRLGAQRNSDVLLERRRLFEEQGPTRWREVCNAVQVSISEVNAELTAPVFTYQNLSTTSFSVTRYGKALGDKLTADFTVNSSIALFWKYEGRSQDTGSCTLAIGDNGQVLFEFKGQGISPEILAQKMLDGLV